MRIKDVKSWEIKIYVYVFTRIKKTDSKYVKIENMINRYHQATIQFTANMSAANAPANSIKNAIIETLKQVDRARLPSQIVCLLDALDNVEGASAPATAAAAAAPAAKAASAKVTVRKPHPTRRPVREDAAAAAAPSETEDPTSGWEDALRKQCANWRIAVKSGPKAVEEGTVGQLKYPDGKIPIEAVTNPNGWPKGTFKKINLGELKDKGFTVEEVGEKIKFLLLSQES